ncbi:high affinity copper uptake protein 1-like isoform X2 [Rhodnius prolixus]|uniref:Copper transport protein n=1 Tax=Rhodnius neglectus TaxID=72488 RepID=A0A0P4VYH9_9HEMI
MFFKFGYELHQLLFSSLNITSVTGLIGVSAVTVVLVLILEASKVALAHSKFYSAILRPNDRPDCFTDDMFLVETQSPSNSIRYFWLGVELGFYIIELILGYVIMLIVMTYNGYLMLSVLLGSGIGYFLGGQTLMKLQIKRSRLNLPCQQCSTLPKNSSLTSSTEAISESVREEQENKCCSGDASSEAETKY